MKIWRRKILHVIVIGAGYVSRSPRAETFCERLAWFRMVLSSCVSGSFFLTSMFNTVKDNLHVHSIFSLFFWTLNARHFFCFFLNNNSQAKIQLYNSWQVFSILTFWIKLLVLLNENVGQPKRHLLTTGWSTFVTSKKLVAGDEFIFLRSLSLSLSH